MYIFIEIGKVWTTYIFVYIGTYNCVLYNKVYLNVYILHENTANNIIFLQVKIKISSTNNLKSFEGRVSSYTT